jgi:hypothetical protein
LEINPEQILLDAIKQGMAAAVKEKLNGYHSPVASLIEETVKSHRHEIQSLLDDAIKSCVGDAEFREDIKSQTRKGLAKTLVARFGGEIEKQVNALKSDPTTRARIVMAIEEIVTSK